MSTLTHKEILCQIELATYTGTDARESIASICRRFCGDNPPAVLDTYEHLKDCPETLEEFMTELWHFARDYNNHTNEDNSSPIRKD